MKDPVKEHILGALFVTTGPAGRYDKAVKKQIMDLEAIIHIAYPTLENLSGSYVITGDFLEEHGISQEEAWQAALFPAKYSFVFRGISASETHVLPAYASDFFILVQKGMYTENAAAVLLFPEILDGVCRKVGTESLALIPVSSESMLLYKGSYEIAELSGMLDTMRAGRKKIRPEMRLPQTIYKYDHKGHGISYLAAQFSLRDGLPVSIED